MKTCYLYIRNEFPHGFCVKQKLTEEEKKIITQEKDPGHVAQGHKRAALMKKRKEEILHNKNSLQYSLQYNLQNSLQNSLQYNLQNSLQYSLQYSHYK